MSIDFEIFIKITPLENYADLWYTDIVFWLNAKIISPLGDLTYIDKATNNFKGGNHDSSI